MKSIHLNVWVLTVAQSLMMAVNSMIVFAGGLIGGKLAPVAKLATLPIASLIIGTAAMAIPISLLMRKYGRKKCFITISVCSVFIALISAYAILEAHFFLLCFSAFLLGTTNACVMQFRFAAMESVPTAQIPTAASTVLLGGIAAAFIGPEVALSGKNLFATEFVGSFVLLAVLFLAASMVLLIFENPIPVSSATAGLSQRSLKAICSQNIFWVAVSGAAVGYAIMSFIMTGTPVSMHAMDGHSLIDTKRVIQSHILAMYLPSVVSATIIRKIGIPRMMLTGLAAYLLCIGIAFSGHHLGNYWVSLILLGIGWNFLFIGGTTLLPQAYAPEERFKTQAVNEFIVFGMQATAALSAGWILFAIGWEKMLLATVPLIIIQLVVVIRWMVKGKMKVLESSI